MALGRLYPRSRRSVLSEVGCLCTFVDATVRKTAGRTGVASWQDLPSPLRPVAPCPLSPALACSPTRPLADQGPPRGDDRGSLPCSSLVPLELGFDPGYPYFEATKILRELAIIHSRS